MIKNNFLTAGIIIVMMLKNTLGADVPIGVQLAEKQILVRNNAVEPQSLDPHKLQGLPEANILRDLLEGLFINDQDGNIIPGVAESWDNKNFTIWTFHLRRTAKWSNGEPVTAQDFVYSWQRLADPKTMAPNVSYLQYAYIDNIDDIMSSKKSPDTLGIKASNDHILEVTLSEPVPYLIKLLTHSAVSQ